jgi:serine protease inhibitor
MIPRLLDAGSALRGARVALRAVIASRHVSVALRGGRVALRGGRVALGTLVIATLACSDPAAPGRTGPITELPRALSTTEREVLSRSNDFAFTLARELLPGAVNENLFYSPLSASMLLGMILNGADGDTYTQMRRVLAFDGLSQEEINKGYADLIDLLVKLDPSVTVELGNSVWSKQGFAVQPDFLERVRTSFGAEAETVDFGNPATLGRINGWAREATDGRIETIFEELPGNVVMVLLNAIYFKAGWTTPFPRAQTSPAPFTRPDGSQVTADLMFLEAELPTLHAATFSLFELPYGGEAYSMVVALPAEGVPVSSLVQNLSGPSWDGWTGGLRKGKAMVRLPRFELEWERKLNEPLQALGMTDAFDGARADFRRLTSGGGVWLSLVKQKSFVKVDEEGTVAAAVTGGVMTDSAPLPIVVDRPFLFVIRERLTGAILFLGVVNDPTA